MEEPGALADPPQKAGGSVAVDLAAGTAGGVAQLLVGHPFGERRSPGSLACDGRGALVLPRGFQPLPAHPPHFPSLYRCGADTVKVKLQTSRVPLGALDATREVLRAQGPLGLYKVSAQRGCSAAAAPAAKR